MALASSPIISAVGSDHKIGRTRRMMMARANPAPPRMSSMPYGPPETIKYVAAMSGSNRILRAGLRAGDIDVNVTKSQGQLRPAFTNIDGRFEGRNPTGGMACGSVENPGG